MFVYCVEVVKHILIQQTQYSGFHIPYITMKFQLCQWTTCANNVK